MTSDYSYIHSIIQVQINKHIRTFSTLMLSAHQWRKICDSKNNKIFSNTFNLVL